MFAKFVHYVQEFPGWVMDHPALLALAALTSAVVAYTVWHVRKGI